jgi:molecular chaperone GrpE
MTEPLPEETSPEETSSETSEEQTLYPPDPNGPTLAEALQQIAALNKQAAEAQDKMLRALADAENTRRRSERDRQDTAKFSVTGFARDLLTVSDNLRRALNAIPSDHRDANEQLNTIYEGVEATERELLRVFEKNSIMKIEPLGQKFDPNLHEVIFEIPSADKEPGTVMQVVEPGYMIHERLLRPARVGVAKAMDGGAAPSGGSMVDRQV